MKNKIALYSALLLSLGGIATTGVSAFADATDSNATSNATIKFLPGDGVTPPVDPDDPDNPDPGTDPEDPGNGGTGEVGPLSIDYVSNLSFGEQKISGANAVYEAKNTTPRIQVTDTRGDKKAGWRLSATASPFTGQDANAQNVVLRGTELSLKNGTAVTTTGNNSAAPTVSDVVLDGSSTAVDVMTAAPDSGQGTWVDKYAASNVTLKVPAGSAENGVDYKATIDWNMVSAP
ncbi:extracellular protein [Enterococcus mundtii 3F]|uniref:Cell surface protein n=1 Tax=Enterococcus faecium TaxID=1352 RepID=A0A0D5MBC3_ENTFC|nr:MULTISPECIES: WxL domain-containing protein [Enterococcus]AJY53575.1 cell surface protein [Enterococcus faecium]MDA9462041.1 extracellular protein [Enterococcus mundtii 3F]